jgi:hypothetical protein
MKNELREVLAGYQPEFALRHIRWLTDHTPNRISGGGQDLKAAQYIRDTLASYGLEAGLQEFTTYGSNIGSGRLEILGEQPWVPAVKACLHVDSTPLGGIEAEVVAVGPGGREDYEGLDVRGKIVLAEVSYAPATPEKARLASEQGAAGMILMNWGRADEDNIPWRALKAVWGNPTRDTWNEMPRLHAVAVTRRDGERLKEECGQGPVRVKLEVQGSRDWMRVVQPVAWLRAPESSPEHEQFVVISGHLDAWEPGVTDNASGNAVMLELARVLAERRSSLRRSAVFCFWNGHEIAEAAGSTYFVDTHWEELNRHAIAYTNIDSVGMRGTTHLNINSSPELAEAHRTVTEELLGKQIDSRRLERIGDQSFFGIGVPAISARHGFPEHLVREWNGATLGWWNHCDQDTFEQLDEGILAQDGRFWTGLIHSLLTSERLPHQPERLIDELLTRTADMVGTGEDPAELSRIPALLEKLQKRFTDLAGFAADPASVLLFNQTALRLGRHLTALRATVVGRYGQDSYGLTDLREMIPMLAPLVRYRSLPADDPERFLLETELLRIRHRFTDAISASLDELDALEAKLQRSAVTSQP